MHCIVKKHFAGWALVGCLGLLALLGSAVEAANDEASNADPATESETDALLQRGQAIYAELCASCHGDHGEGVEDGYDMPLTGDDSLGELSQRITETMPEGEAEQCVAQDAEAVATYIHYAFYSEAARIRNRPPRIELTHLTGNQLRQSLADLYAHFSGSMEQESQRGINARYFDGSKNRRNNEKIERVDAVIDFDWQHDGPGEGIHPQDFFVQWRGGLKVDETGRYEIVIRSSCAFVCDLGKFDREFINNRVQSGDETEFRKSVVLTAGRVYPIEIDLYQRKRKTEQPPARISLSWIPPSGVEAIVPSNNLLPTSPPATFSLQSKLPPDDRSYGFDRGLSVDRQWDDSTTASAIEFAATAVAELWPDYLRQHESESVENRETLRSFLAELAEIAFRGPLDEVTRQFYVDAQVDQTEDDAEAIKRSLLVILKAPRFLYPELDQDRSVSQRAANRLALCLFDSLPADKSLLDLVHKDKLQTQDQVRATAEQMVLDYRARAKTRELMYEWLNLSHIGDITKNAEAFPGFDEQLVAELKASLDAFLNEVVDSDTSDFRQFFSADWTSTTPRLAEFYGVASPPHVGLISHPFLMSKLAYPDSTSPIHRGVFLMRYVLGRTLRPPNEAFTPLSPDLHPDLSTRQRVELQTSPQNCQVCHVKINGLGFALENFDAVGRFREQEADKPIDSSGHYTTRDGLDVQFQGSSELAQFLASSPDAHQAFVNRAFQHLVKQPIAAYGPNQLHDLTDRFRDSNFHIRNLLVEIATIAATQPKSSDAQQAEPARGPAEHDEEF